MALKNKLAASAKRLNPKAAVSKIRRAPKAPQGRITNDTIDQHREHILTSGRRFKYPMQYARHKLVFNTILLSLGLLVVITLFGWYQLYVAQNTSSVTYRVTQALPVPVASIDGTPVRYSDYLMRFRSEVYWLEQNNQINTNTDDGKRQAEYRKRQALDDAISITYARKIAGERKIVIREAQVDEFIDQARRANGISISREAYYGAQFDAYNWSRSEVRDNIRNSLLRREVAFSIDDSARSLASQVLAGATAQGADLPSVAKGFADAGSMNVTYADAGTIPLTSQDPNGVIRTIRGLDVGAVSGQIRGIDGYYVAKLLEKTGTTIHYSYVKVGLTTFTGNLTKLREEKKINEYVKITTDVTQP